MHLLVAFLLPHALALAQSTSSTIAVSSTIAASDATPAAADATPTVTTKTERDSALDLLLENLSNIKLSGYIQGRFEFHEDSRDGLSGTGRPATTTQFLVRRARLKSVYSAKVAEFVLQIEAAGAGVTLRDAEATFIEPWSGMGLRLTLGQFKEPFGYEALQSSGVREMPERARVIRVLFPGERDRGARFQVKHDFLRFSAAVVNGNLTTDPVYQASDQNKFKDILGRLGADFGWLALGISGYWGETPIETRKSRIGADVAVAVPIPDAGTLALKGEWIRGQENGGEAMGWWLLAVQNIGKFAAFARLDRYDPDVGKQDNAITTFGGGVHALLSEHLKVSAVYEHPMSQGAADAKDDIFTLQSQAMF